MPQSGSTPQLGIVLYVDDQGATRAFARWNKNINLTRDEARKFVRDVQVQYGKVNQSHEETAKSSTKSTQSQIKSLRSLRWEIITAMFFFRLFSTAVREGWKAIQAAQEDVVRQGGISALAQTYEQNSTAIVRSLQSITEGALSTRDATQAVQQALTTDAGRLAASYDDLYQAAEVVNIVVGTEAPNAFSALVEAIDEADASAVDSVANYYNAERAVLDYAQSTGRLVEELTDQEIRQVLLNQVQARTNELLANGAQEILDHQRAIGQLRRSWGELRDVTLQNSTAVRLYGEGIEWLTGLLETVTRISVLAIAGFEGFVDVVESLDYGTLAQDVVGRTMLGQFYTLQTDVEEIFDTLGEGVRESLTDSFELLGYLDDQLGEITNNTEEYGEAATQVGRDDLTLLERRLELYRSMAESIRRATIEMERQRQEMEIERVREIEDAYIDLARRREEIEIRLVRKLEDINIEYLRRIEEVEARNRSRRMSIERRYRDRLITIEERYLERLRRIQEDYQMSLWEAIGERDATAALQAQRERDLEMRRAGRDRDQQRREAERDYQRQLEDLRDALEDQRREAERAAQEAREDAERARQRAQEDAVRDYQQAEEDLARSLQRRLEDLQRNLEHREADLQDHYDRQLQLMAEQHEQEMVREAAYQTEQLEMYRNYLQSRLQYYESYMGQMGFQTPDVDPYQWMPGGVGGPGAIPGFAEGGHFIARSPQLIMVGEVPEEVRVTPLSEIQQGGSTQTVQGNINHSVQGMVQAQMQDFSGRLGAAVNAAVLNAIAEVLQ